MFAKSAPSGVGETNSTISTKKKMFARSAPSGVGESNSTASTKRSLDNKMVCAHFMVGLKCIEIQRRPFLTQLFQGSWETLIHIPSRIGWQAFKRERKQAWMHLHSISVLKNGNTPKPGKPFAYWLREIRTPTPPSTNSSCFYLWICMCYLQTPNKT